jgi:hypothetical protein
LFLVWCCIWCAAGSILALSGLLTPSLNPFISGGGEFKSNYSCMNISLHLEHSQKCIPDRKTKTKSIFFPVRLEFPYC